MKYLKSLPAPLFIIATVLISSGCSQKNYDVDAGEKIIYPSGDGVLLGACDKWTLKDEQVRQLIAMSKPYIALPSVDIDTPSIMAPEMGISVPGTSAPTLDIKAPAVSLPGAEVPVPALKNPF